MATQERLDALLRNAPKDAWALIELLRDGLNWPFPDHSADLQLDDVLIDWEPEELHLDPTKVATVTDILQIPKFTESQDFGAFVLNFTGGRMPVGAVRRIVDRLIANRRSRTGSARLPQWSDVNDLILFCLGSDPQRVIHIVSFREEASRRSLRVLNWSTTATQTQLDLISQRDLAALRWKEPSGPDLVGRAIDSPGFGTYRGTIRNAKALATHMAAIAQRLRQELLDMYEVELEDGPIQVMYREFQRELIGDLTPDKFADVFAQTMVYGLLSERITHPEKFQGTAALQIDFDNPLLNALYGKFTDDVTTGIDLNELGLDELAADLASPELDVEKMLADFGTRNRREDPVVHFYEEFLNQYDHAQRIDAGAFYTPTPVVEFMVEAVDHLLKAKFGLDRGIADEATWGEVAEANGFDVPRSISPKQRFVSMIDPATGTGTYLVEWIRRAKKSFLATGPDSAWPEHFKNVVMPSMHAFEIMLAPYAVAHLKVALESNATADIDPEISILLTDTLQQPGQELIFGATDDPVAAEGERANELKLHERFTVCIGNPPYDREQHDDNEVGARRKGGIVRFGADGIAPLLSDVLAVMKDRKLGRHIKNLYNDYVYFWRWAMWRTTERPLGPGIAAFITPSSYLDGKSMAGLRAVMRERFDEFYIVNLGGDSLGAHADDNVFDIRVGVTIGIGVRDGRDRQLVHPCKVNYVRVSGSREEKLNWLSTHAFASVDFEPVSGADVAKMTPRDDSDYWNWPALDQLLPWSHSGSQLKRKWPIAPSVSALRARWHALIQLTGTDQSVAFRETDARGPDIGGRSLVTGRKTPPLATPGGEQMTDPVRYGYRSFDRQWTIPDTRVSDRPRPELWAVHSDRQVYLSTLTSTKLGGGPALVATPYVPDLDFFRNRGARDIFPVWRDSGAARANVTRSLLATLAPVLGELSASDLVAYVYGLASTPAFTQTFADLLAAEAGPIHIPITRDRSLFDEISELGHELLHLHTFGERLGSTAIEVTATELAPILGHPESFSYDPQREELRIGDGRVGPVSTEVYNFEVSSFKVLQSWLAKRMAGGHGRSSSPLDKIDGDGWEFTEELVLVASILQHTVDATPRGKSLLDRVIAGDVFSGAELPEPTDTERAAPK